MKNWPPFPTTIKNHSCKNGRLRGPCNSDRLGATKLPGRQKGKFVPQDLHLNPDNSVGFGVQFSSSHSHPIHETGKAIYHLKG